MQVWNEDHVNAVTVIFRFLAVLVQQIKACQTNLTLEILIYMLINTSAFENQMNIINFS